MKAGVIAVVEAGYAVDLPENEWVGRICNAMFAAFPIGKTCFGFLYDASTPNVRARCTNFAGAPIPSFDPQPAMDQLLVPLPEPMIATFYDPSPPTGVASEHFAHIPRFPELWAFVHQLLGDDVTDMVAVRAGGSDRRGVLLGFLLTRAKPGLAPNTREVLDRVGVHLAAAHRLRSSAERLASLDSASAILTPSARVEHLGEDPDVHASRGALVDAVRRMERARSKLGRRVPDTSLAAWRALVSGHWSVLDFVDRDGKRFIVARRNEPRGRDLLAITDTERQVLELASLGHSNKLIAYELGLAQSTVASHVKLGLRKSGIATRAELVALRSRTGLVTST